MTDHFSTNLYTGCPCRVQAGRIIGHQPVVADGERISQGGPHTDRIGGITAGQGHCEVLAFVRQRLGLVRLAVDVSHLEDAEACHPV